MVIQIFENQVVLKDDHDKELASISFPMVQEGICQITDIKKDSSISQKSEGLLMLHAIRQIRKNNWKVLANSGFSHAWFTEHPEDADLLAHVVTEAPPEEEPKDEEIHLTKQHTIQPENKPTKTKAAAGLLKIVVRVFQLMSALCMIGIAALFGWQLYQNQIVLYQLYMVQSQMNLAFLAFSAFFIAFCILETIWILTRKSFVYEDHVNHVDSGRGIFGFIVVLVVYIAARFLTMIFGFMEIMPYVQAYFVNLLMIPTLSIVGLVLSIFRKMLRR